MTHRGAVQATTLGAIMEAFPNLMIKHRDIKMRWYAMLGKLMARYGYAKSDEPARHGKCPECGQRRDLYLFGREVYSVWREPISKEEEARIRASKEGYSFLGQTEDGRWCQEKIVHENKVYLCAECFEDQPRLPRGVHVM